MKLPLPRGPRWLCAVLLLLSAHPGAWATHILGGDIAYEPVNAAVSLTRYRVTVRLYQVLGSAVDQPSVTLLGSRDGCSSPSPNNFSLTVARSSVVPAFTVGCPGSPGFNYQINLYQTEVELPPASWTLSVTAENRTDGILNILGGNSININLQISSRLDNTLAPNSSPRFLTAVLPYLSGSSPQQFSFSTFDAESDSLVYRAVTPQMNLDPRNSCGRDVPSFTAQPFQVDSTTGALTAPGGAFRQGRYALAVRVDEYRRLGGRWRLMGHVVRDITYLAVSSVQSSPYFADLTVEGNPAAQALSQPIRVQPGQPTRLRLRAVAGSGGQTLRFVSAATAIVPGLSLVPAGPDQVELRWQVPAALPAGRYRATVAVLDDACPVNGSQEVTLTFVVAGQPLATRPEGTGTTPAAYPMPFRDQVTFWAEPNQSVTILDGLGREVAHLSSPASGWVRWQPAAGLPAGLYLARGARGRLLARLLRAAE